MEGRFADAVIVAAGASRRMGGTDKLAVPLLGRPLLAWALEAVSRAASVRRLIVVAAAERVEQLANQRWLAEASRGLPVSVVGGGARRRDSVRAGLRASEAPVVLVHDGARPLATPELADSVAQAAARDGAAVPIVPVADSLRRIAGGRVAAIVEREGVGAAQTPQGARRELLDQAFAALPEADDYTDEAAMLAAIGVPVTAVPGERGNLKVTTPDDLEAVSAVLSLRAGPAATSMGMGHDSHPFGPGDGLWLGGVLIEGAPRLFGHSDGDVALHALATAVLAAARREDLGRRFPPTDEATAGAPSAGLLRAVLDDVRADGWRVASAQLSLTGARPRLGGERLEMIRTRVAELLGVGPDAVAVTASTGNLAGPEGAGLVIGASALVSLARS
jgi:2-C-methyl-D-erythritol 4-phosphate cytidylyltransferase / 2-C-methyl-D-erythritol 2,4-cyclodiphosphate synthase